MITAEEYLDKYLHANDLPWDESTPKIYSDIHKAMIEFAKYHVQQTLNGVIPIIMDKSYGGPSKEEIMNSYPLENIK